MKTATGPHTPTATPTRCVLRLFRFQLPSPAPDHFIVMAVLRRVLVYVVGATAVLAADKCYYPNGKLVSGTAWETCSSSDSCCSTGDACLPGGLCVQPNKSVYRGACTDKLWGKECGSRCNEGTRPLDLHLWPHPCGRAGSCGICDLQANVPGSVSKTGTATLTKCATNKYCCKTGSADCCKDSDNVFGVQVDVATTSAKTSPTTSAKKTSSTPSSTASSTSSESTTTSTEAPVTTNTPPPGTATPPPQSPPADSSGGASNELKVGVGAGIGGGIAVVALIAGLAWYKAVKSRRQHDDNFQLLTPAPQSQVQLTQLRQDGTSPAHPPADATPYGYFTREKRSYPDTYPGT